MSFDRVNTFSNTPDDLKTLFSFGNSKDKNDAVASLTKDVMYPFDIQNIHTDKTNETKLSFRSPA